MKTHRTVGWNKDNGTAEKLTFTMRREIDKAREESDLINQLRNVRDLWKMSCLNEFNIHLYCAADN